MIYYLNIYAISKKEFQISNFRLYKKILETFKGFFIINNYKNKISDLYQQKNF